MATVKPIPVALMPIKATPFSHQIEAFNFVCGLFGLDVNGRQTSAGAALLMEMGTGKTLTSIAITGALYREGFVRRALIVAPLSILGVWEAEFQKFSAFHYTLEVLTGTLAKKRQALRCTNGPALRVAVVNYESAWRLEAELLKWKPDLIIADEAHKIKTHNISASKAMHRLGVVASYKLLLTGTVITNKALDVFSQYKFLNPAIFGTSFYSFRNRYFDMVGYGNYTPVLKQRMEPELTARLHSIAYRATKAECLDLPPVTDVIHPVVLEDSAYSLYQAVAKESYAELSLGEITAPNILTRLLRLSQITGGFVNPDESTAQQVSSAKLAALDEILDSSTQESQKLVIVARFIPEIRAICKLLEKKRLRYSIITGAVKDRAEQVDAFQTNPDVSVFVGQIATAGLGITLTAASTLVFYSLDYSMSNYEQTKARIHRVGQDYPCTYIHLIAIGTVDEKVLKALRDKADLARMLIDEYRAGRNPFGQEEASHE